MKNCKKLFLLIIVSIITGLSCANAANSHHHLPQDSYIYNQNIHYAGNRLMLDTCSYLAGPMNSRETLNGAHWISDAGNCPGSTIMKVVVPSSCTNPGYMIIKCNYSKTEGILFWKKTTNCQKTQEIKLVLHSNNSYMPGCPHDPNTVSQPTLQPTLQPAPQPTLQPTPQPTPQPTLHGLLPISHINAANDIKISKPNSIFFKAGDTFTITINKTCVYTDSNSNQIDIPVVFDFKGFRAQLTKPYTSANSSNYYQTSDGIKSYSFKIIEIKHDELKYDTKQTYNVYSEKYEEIGYSYAKIKVSSAPHIKCNEIGCLSYHECTNCNKTETSYFLPVSENRLNDKSYFEIVSVRDLAWKNVFLDKKNNLRETSFVIPDNNGNMLYNPKSDNETVKLGYATEFELFTTGLDPSDSKIVITPTLMKSGNTKISWDNVTDELKKSEVDSKFKQITILSTDINTTDSFMTQAKQICYTNSFQDTIGGQPISYTYYDTTWKWVYYLPPQISYPGMKKTDSITINFNIEVYSKGVKVLDIQKADKSSWEGNTFTYSIGNSLLEDIYNNSAF